MKVTQVYSIVNEAVKQALGETAVAVNDATWIQTGNSVLNSSDDACKDKFMGALFDQIGKIIVSNRAYNGGIRTLLDNAFEFGAAMEKITVQPSEASASQQWTLTEGQSVDPFTVTKPSVNMKLFTDRTSWQVKFTIPDMQLNSAFRSPEEMAAFINAYYVAMENTMQMELENMASLTYGAFFAHRIVHTKVNGGHTVINLLADYNALTAGTMTQKQAMHSLDFLKYATTQINLYKMRMARMSKQFNAAGWARHTPPELLRVTMLADFSSAVSSYMQSDTFHDELVTLPEYEEIPYWQGSGTVYDFESTSNVDLKVTDQADPTKTYTVNQNGLVCMMTDVEALGMTYDNRRSKAIYNPDGEYTNYWYKADMGYYNDLSENGIAFVIADAINDPVLA